MKEFDELQQLWSKLDQEPKLDFEKIMKRVRQENGDLVNKFLWHAIAFVVAIALLGLVWYHVPFFTWTSHLAIFLLMGCLAFALFQQWNAYRKLRQSTAYLFQPKECIEFLKRFQKNQTSLHTKAYKIYEACMVLGFALFSFELYFALPLAMFLILVAFIIVWFVFAHFIWMQNYSRHENERIQRLVDDLERIQDQFSG